MLVESIYSEDNSIVEITLNRPRYANSLNLEFVESLIAEIDKAHESSARLLVLKGNGHSFCGGFDLREIESETEGSLVYRFLRLEQLLQKIYYSPIYTLALAHGAVIGSGADIVAACKRRVVISNASFRFPGVRFGVLLGTNRLRSIINQAAYQMLLEQESIDLTQALAYGLIHNVVQEGEEDTFICELNKKIKKVPYETSSKILQLDKQKGLIDMGLLANSVADPNFKTKIKNYWLDVKKQS